MKYKIVRGQYPAFDLPWVVKDRNGNHVAEFYFYNHARLFRKVLVKREKSS